MTKPKAARLTPKNLANALEYCGVKPTTQNVELAMELLDRDWEERLGDLINEGRFDKGGAI